MLDFLGMLLIVTFALLLITVVMSVVVVALDFIIERITGDELSEFLMNMLQRKSGKRK